MEINILPAKLWREHFQNGILICKRRKDGSIRSINFITLVIIPNFHFCFSVPSDNLPKISSVRFSSFYNPNLFCSSVSLMENERL
jgi:hypothetical protein